MGMTNVIIVPLVLGIFGYALTPKVMVFTRSSKPVPVIVTCVPTGPAIG